MPTQEFIAAALLEDVGSGDYSTLASIPADAIGKAVLKIEEEGILAGMQLAQDIFHHLEEDAKFSLYKKDGDAVKNGETAFTVEASVHTILKAEKPVLNCMQRMSGIATLTNTHADKKKATKPKYSIPAKPRRCSANTKSRQCELATATTFAWACTI